MQQEQLKQIILNPLDESAGTVVCQIRRVKGILQKTRYLLILKEGGKFLLSSQKKSMNKTSNYYISMDYNNSLERGPQLLGKLRSNFGVTNYHLYDNLDNPNKAKSFENIRREFALIIYQKNQLGIKGPRKVNVAIPKIEKDGQFSVIKPFSEDSETGINRMFEKSMQINSQEVQIFNNVQPKWNDQIQAYILNFDNVKLQPSIKNFKLVKYNNIQKQEGIYQINNLIYKSNIQLEENQSYLIFGKIGKNDFYLQFRHPFSIYQAFSIALSSFDSSIIRE